MERARRWMLAGGVAAAALLALLATISLVRGRICGGEPWVVEPTRLFCPDKVPDMLAAQLANRASAALREHRLDEFAGILAEHPERDFLQHLLPVAAQAGDARAVALLLDRGADPDALSPHVERPWETRELPLAIAARQGNFAVVRLLLARGAGPDGALRGTAREEARLRPMPVVRMGDDNVTPFYAAIDCILDQTHRLPRGDTATCRRIALLLAERGATIVGSERLERVIQELDGEEREKAASLLLAVADRNGRWDDMIARMKEATGPTWVREGMTRPNRFADFRPWVLRAEACGPGRLRARGDHYAFC